MFLCFRYDVELYQRIEYLIGKQLPLYKTEEDEAMMLMERVTEAQRIAKMEVKEKGELKGRSRKSKKDGDDDDTEQSSGVRKILKKK